ncbi:TonB-dependent receptor [Roseateles sp. LKC17W]|uniref:TonB-dependent receptor n=1 Tax=Pelomonas margarita TaxID=3299031 RepID=A0ABW7FEJ4_9BURK
MNKPAQATPRASATTTRFALSLTAAAALAALSSIAVAQQATAKTETQLETVVITGARASAETAQAIKKNSDQVVDSIVAEDIGKFPDKNVAELLGRVPGVQLQRGLGEAGTVIVRGLGGVATLLNGREFFTDAGRNLFLADVPASMLKRIDVYKTQEASLPEGGTAGVIDVRTHRPLDFKNAQLYINGRIENRDKADVNNPDLSGMASNRWKTGFGEVGALFGIAYNNSKYHDERAWVGDPQPIVVPGRTNPILASDAMGRVLDLGHRKRLAGNFALQWKPSADKEIYLEGFATSIDHRYQQSFLVGGIGMWNDNGTWRPNAGTVITAKPGTDLADTITSVGGWGFTSTQAKRDTVSNAQTALGAIWDVTDRLKVTTELAVTNSQIDHVNRILDSGYNPVNVTAKVQDGGGYIDYPGLAMTNKANFRINGGVDVRQEREGKNTDWRADATYDLGDGFFREVSGGVRLAKRKAMSQATTMPWQSTFAGTGQTVNQAAYADMFTVSPATWGEFGVKQYVYADREWLLNNGEAFRKLITGGNGALTPYDPMALFDDTETTKALYGRLKFGMDIGRVPVSGVFGLRVVQTDQELMGNSRNANTNVITPVNLDTSRTDVLPTLSLKAELTSKLIARMVAGKTIERPAFNQYNPGTTTTGGTWQLQQNGTYLQTQNGTIGGGNPDLKPTESANVDVSLEYYFARTGFVSATGFQHKFKNRIFDKTVTIERPNAQYGKNEKFNVTQPINISDAKLHGYELSYRQFYDFLPGWMSGFGLEANYTFMTGKQTDPNGVEGPFLGQSKSSYNLVGLYERDNLYARLAYNWRAKFLAEKPYRSTGRELWVAPMKTLDASLGYTFNKQWTLSVDVTNLLNQSYHDYFDKNPSIVRDVRYYDRTIGVSVRWKL